MAKHVQKIKNERNSNDALKPADEHVELDLLDATKELDATDSAAIFDASESLKEEFVEEESLEELSTDIAVSEDLLDQENAGSRESGTKGTGAKHSKKSTKAKKNKKGVVRSKKSRRMRRVLIVAIVLLIILAAALAYFTIKLVQESQLVAMQQAQQRSESETDAQALQDEDTKDATEATTKTTEVPNLAALLGMTQDEAIAELQHGATASAAREVNEEGNPIKSMVNVALTAEPSDTRSGTPTVYLGMDEEGVIIQAGYSASTLSLGYGSLSFSDAVKNEHIVEKTLAAAGATVEEESVSLPTDKKEYSTYASDGTTLVKESCSFSGDADIDGQTHEWSAVLSYDYAMANASGNLSDTIRTIYIYINA